MNVWKGKEPASTVVSTLLDLGGVIVPMDIATLTISLVNRIAEFHAKITGCAKPPTHVYALRDILDLTVPVRYKLLHLGRVSSMGAGRYRPIAVTPVGGGSFYYIYYSSLWYNTTTLEFGLPDVKACARTIEPSSR